MSIPNRPADETQSNVGKRYGPPRSTELAPDNNFAGTSYVTGCSGTTATNPGQPSVRYVLNNGQTLNSNNLTVVESDGTVKQYFSSGNETVTDTYNTNPGLSEGKWNALSSSQKALYCEPGDVSGGVVTGVSITNEGEYIASNGRSYGGGSGTGLGLNISYGTRSGTFGQSTYIKSVSITNGGKGYKVGDTIRVAGVDFSPSIQEPGEITITGATAITGGGTRYLKTPSKRTREVSTQLNVRIWRPTSNPSPQGNDTECQPFNTKLREVTVTGNKSGTFYGCGPYRWDSDIAAVAVHQGLLEDGQTGVIEVRSADANEQDSFDGGCQQNGAIATAISGAGASGCTILTTLKSKIEQNPDNCDPISDSRTETLTVGNSTETRGGVAEFELVNPYPPKFYVPTLPSNNLEGGQTNTKEYDKLQANWMFSCPPRAYDDGCTKLPAQSYVWTHVAGPSLDEPFGADKTGFRMGYKLTSYCNATDYKGCLGGTNCPCVENVSNKQVYLNYYAYDLPVAGNLGPPTTGKGSPRSTERGTGWAIGDTFELRPKDRNDEFYEDNLEPRIRVTALHNPVAVGESTIEYRVQNDVKLNYDRLVAGQNFGCINDYVVTIDTGSTTDSLLSQSAQSCLTIFQNELGRNPQKLEFEKYTRKIYADNGNTSQAVTDLKNEYSAIQHSVTGIEDCCSSSGNGQNPSPSGNDPSPTAGSSDECKEDRNTFYRGTGGTTNGEVDLNELWQFFGAPRNNPNPICPRPENDSGLVQDNEPDMSDFYGLTLQRWKACTDGSNNGNTNLGTYETIIVPCEGPEIISGVNADYYKNATITWSNGDTDTGDYVKATKNPTAEAINNKYLNYLGRNAKQAGLDYWVNDVLVKGIPLSDTLLNIEAAALDNGEGPNTDKDEVVSFVIPDGDNGLNLSYFIDTRIAPWWGDLELAPCTLTMGKVTDNIYMVNVPPTQNDFYYFKAQPTVSANGKKFFQVNGSVNYPDITGTPTPGEPTIELKNDIEITWIKRLQNGTNVTMAEYKRFGGGYKLYNGSQMTVAGTGVTGQSGNWETTLVIQDAVDGQTSKIGAEALEYNTTGDYYYCKVQVINRPDNPKSPGTSMPGFGGAANNFSTASNNQCKFFLNNIDCQDASIGCSGNQTLEVNTNEPTTITFSMSISTNCLAYRSGTARISIKREWPCAVFGPADPRQNQWLVENATVGIPQTNQNSALIQYTLTVPTNKQDYLPGEPGIDVDPGDCHWKYRAYWEIDYPGVECRSNAWSWGSEDCQCGEGLRQLPEIYCSQRQNCENNPCGANSPGNGPSGGGGCQNNTGIPDAQFDFNTCLPLCSSQSTAYFYWYYIYPEPGVNCSGPVSGNPSPGQDDGPAPGESPFGPGCECPACEQTITVKILDTSKCGILGPPNQQEGGGSGPNNAVLEAYSPTEGMISWSDRQTNPTVMPKDVLAPCDPDLIPGASPDDKCIEIFFEDWVYLPRKTFDTLTTLGNDAAIKIIDYDKPEVDCSETVFTQASWYIKFKYLNGTSSALQPLPIWLGGAEWDSYLARYNPSAGTNTEALRYVEEVGNSSLKRSFGVLDIPYDTETVKSAEIYLNITSTNDYFGNALYHPPPAGFFERDFATETTIRSQRGVWGSTGTGAEKPVTFQVANFAIADKVDLPEFKNPPSISCPSNPVPYDGIRVTPDIFEFCCGGEIGGCQNTSVSFACQIACESGGCDKQPLSGPKAEINACATNSDGVFSIDWKEIEPADRRQLTILWYFGRGNSTGCCFNEGNLSQGDTCSPDINNTSKLAQPETTYTLSYFIVASSDGDVSYREIRYDDEGPNGYFDRLSWLLTPNINSCERPYQSTEVKKGERWQTIMGSGSCTIITGKDLDTQSIENPYGSISIVNITNPDGGTGDGPIDCSKGNCCNPSNPEYYGRPCIEIRAGLQAAGIPCCDFSSPSPNIAPGPGPGPSPGPAPSPFNPVGPGPFNPSINPF